MILIRLLITFIFCHWKTNQQSICFQGKSRSKTFDPRLAQLQEKLNCCLQSLLSLRIPSRHEDHQVPDTRSQGKGSMMPSLGHTRYLLPLQLQVIFSLQYQYQTTKPACSQAVCLKSEARKGQWHNQLAMPSFPWGKADQ